MTSRMHRRQLLIAALTGAALATPARALGHDGHEGFGWPALFIYGARRTSEDTVVELDVLLSNTFGVAATLRGLSSPIADRVSILRRRAFFGVELWQPISLLRLDVAEAVQLERPDYAVAALGVTSPPTERLRFDVVGDFGPLGAVTATAVAPALYRPQTTE